MEGLGNLACYQAFVPYMVRKILLKKLDETGMRKVYDEIELSAGIYIGFHGKMGDFCQGRGTEKLR